MHPDALPGYRSSKGHDQTEDNPDQEAQAEDHLEHGLSEEESEESSHEKSENTEEEPHDGSAHEANRNHEQIRHRLVERVDALLHVPPPFIYYNSILLLFCQVFLSKILLILAKNYLTQ